MMKCSFPSSALAVLLLPSLLHLVSAASYSNPLRAVNGGDPNIVYHDGYYYLMTTNFNNLEMTRAKTLEGLKHGQTQTVWDDKTPERCCNVWAAEMHLIDNAFHIYYTAGPAALGLQQSHVLRGGSTPWEKYTYLAKIETPDWAIDGTILRVSNQTYFVYSGFEGGGFESKTGTQSLFITTLTDGYRNGTHHLLSKPTQPWETVGNPVNEGPAALYHNGRTFIVFSASFCWTPSYSLGMLELIGDKPLQMSSWRKTGPVFSSANKEFGTGHNSFFTAPDGKEIWNVYHSTPASGGNCGADRATNALVMKWHDDGTPNFGTPLGYGVVLPGPKGEP